MSVTQAYLYDSALRPVGPVGVLAQVNVDYIGDVDAAIFSPWPDALPEGTAFVVRIVADGKLTSWRSPIEVHDFRLAGRPAETNVAFVLLEGAATAPISLWNAGGGLRTDKDPKKRGILTALRAHTHQPDAVQLFEALSDEAEARIRLRELPIAEDGAARPLVAQPGYIRAVGGPVTIGRSLCQMLRWD